MQEGLTDHSQRVLFEIAFPGVMKHRSGDNWGEGRAQSCIMQTCQGPHFVNTSLFKQGKKCWVDVTQTHTHTKKKKEKKRKKKKRDTLDALYISPFCLI